MFVFALPAALDPLKLRAQLASALGASGWSRPASRAAALAHLKAALAEGLALARSRLDGPGGGLEAARIRAATVDAVLRAVFDSAASDHPEAADTVSLVALGGFGAGELAPRSDVDILFLRASEHREATEALIHTALYVLWDIGLDIGGGATRTVDQALELAREDLAERTALLSLRHLAGSQARTARLAARFAEEICGGAEAEFVEAKMKERDERIQKAGRSRYTVEPNVKNSKGGLRDLQLMRWLAQFLYGEDAFERWVTAGLLTVADVEKYLAAADFLWTVRFHLHEISPNKQDRLSFDVQPEIARRMGYEDGQDTLAVELFMRRYFETAMDVGALTRLVCAKLEADNFKAMPSGLARFLPGGESRTTDLGEGDFVIRQGRLAFSRKASIANDPVLLIRLFQIAASHRMDLHPEAVAAVGRNLSRVDEDFRRDPRAARAFFAILLDAEAPYAVLRMMTEAGLLGRYIPEFGDIVARTQFNMYHRYTVDEHTLQALGLLREFETGEHAEAHPLVTRTLPEITHRRALHLAVLLHDTGKGAGDQCVEGAARAREACDRLGVPEDEAELVAWLIANHLLMSETAQRRDIGDPRTVSDFARAVGSLERLRLLNVLTVVDIRSVGPGVWNDWKGQLLRDLYAATETVLSEGLETGQAGDDRAREALKEKADLERARLREKLERFDPQIAAWWTEELEDAYWLAFGPADRLRHAAFARGLKARQADLAAAVRVDKRRAATEILVFAPDRDRLFADLAAALAAIGANIVGAFIATTRSGCAFDVFYIQDGAGHPYGAWDAGEREDLIAALKLAAVGAGPKTALQRPLKRREAAFLVTPEVRISNDAAESATMIETSGRDRPGLLADLANVIADHDLVLIRAQIDGYGERASDVFYVRVRKGEGAQAGDGKLEDEGVIESLRSAMIAVLGESEDAHAAKAAERGLARARASALR